MEGQDSSLGSFLEDLQVWWISHGASSIKSCALEGKPLVVSARPTDFLEGCMSIVFIGINHKKPFLLPFLDVASTLEVFVPTIIHKTLGLVQVFPRSLKKSKEPLGSVKASHRASLRGPTQSFGVLILGIYIIITNLKP